MGQIPENLIRSAITRIARDFSRNVRLRELPFLEVLGGECKVCGREKQRRFSVIYREEGRYPAMWDLCHGPPSCVLCVHDAYSSKTSTKLLAEALEANGVNVEAFLDGRQPNRRPARRSLSALRRPRGRGRRG